MSPGENLEQAYEGLRMKALKAGNMIQSQSQLVFLTKGMKVWLETVGGMNPLIVEPKQTSREVEIPRIVKPIAVMLLTDMALNTWNEVSTC